MDDALDSGTLKLGSSNKKKPNRIQSVCLEKDDKLVGNFDIGDLAGRLQNINDEEEEEERRKQEFEEKRKKHYANEYKMANALKNRNFDDEDEEDN